MTRAARALRYPSLPSPPLEPGDHLARDEFERRYDAMPELKKAELIEGVVHMSPPAVRWDYHASPQIKLATWLGVYESATPGVRAGDNASIRLGPASEPQPDVVLLIDAASGGQSSIGADNYIEGAPEFVGEVSGSSVSIDMNAKFRDYQRHGVREYLVWRVQEDGLDWFELREGAYAPLTADSQGIIRSRAFPGLWLDVPAMLALDLAAVLRVLQQGISSAEHSTFVAELEARRKPAP